MALVHERSIKHDILNSDSLYVDRQNELFRELEILLNVRPCSIGCSLLSLPRELRDRIFDWVLPAATTTTSSSSSSSSTITISHPPELHTCFWSSDMGKGEPWRHEIFSYGKSVPKADRLPLDLLLVNKQVREEVLESYFRHSDLILHAELRNTRYQTGVFAYSPHVLQLPMLKYVTHLRFYVEWNYTIEKHVVDERRKDQVRMTNNLLKAIDKITRPLQAIQTIELSILFFWRRRSGKVYSLSMSDLFDLEDIFKQHAEQQWLALLRRNKSAMLNVSDCSAGVGYRLSSEKRGTDQSGGMEIFVAQNLEDAMKTRRKSAVDFYGHYGIADPLPQPAYKQGTLI